MRKIYHTRQGKTCPGCSPDKELPIDCFTLRKDGRITPRCKECVRAVDRARRPMRRPRKTPIIPKATKPGHKVCIDCFQEKLYKEFRQDNQRSDGCIGRCKECEKKKWDALPEEEKERLRLQDRTSRVPRREEINARDRKRHSTDKARAKRRDRMAIKKALDPEYLKAISEAQATWRKNNPLYTRESNRRHKIGQKAARSGQVSYARILDRDGHFCYICEKAILPHQEMAFDHKVPLHPRPGEPQGTHTEENIHPTHDVCNMRKANRQFENLSAFDCRGIE